MTCLIGWTDHAQSASFASVTNTELLDATNMLLPGAPSRARLYDGGAGIGFVLDLGEAKRVDAICLLGINARQSWDLTITLGLTVPGSLGAPSMLGHAYSTAGRLPWGASPIVPLLQSYTARFVSFGGTWDIGSDGYYDIRRLLVLECVRSRGLSIASQLTPQHTGQALISEARTATVVHGYGYRTWASAVQNIGRAELYGDETAPGTAPALTDLAATYGNQAEVLLVPRTDSAHMIVQTAIVGRCTSFDIPPRTRGDRLQHARLQMEELLHTA